MNSEKILVLHTGGTIGSTHNPEKNHREVDVTNAKRILFEAFEKSTSKHAGSQELFEDLPLGFETLSENMTFDKLGKIIAKLKSVDLYEYAGVVVLHGTDTLAYTAALFSFVFYDIGVPMMLVSAKSPVTDEESNALDNFSAAVELILDGIAPNIYVPYKNDDGEIYFHIASTLMQCQNYSNDFYNASGYQVFYRDDEYIFEDCKNLSKKRSFKIIEFPRRLSAKKLKVIVPYVGIDYSEISLDGISAVLHGSYHSGTLCVGGFNSSSALTLGSECMQKGIPMFIACCKNGEDKYSSTSDAVEMGGMIPLDMTFEAAYMKLVLAVNMGLANEEIIKFMQTEINNEFIN
ncbi:MAG: asparaginase [Clostridia bacterium]|nr:asparaginase [Clostridia bacterium]